jgi:penicillin V acylase-like amidase (Ntn superfamily)
MSQVLWNLLKVIPRMDGTGFYGLGTFVPASDVADAVSAAMLAIIKKTGNDREIARVEKIIAACKVYAAIENTPLGSAYTELHKVLEEGRKNYFFNTAEDYAVRAIYYAKQRTWEGLEDNGLKLARKLARAEGLYD